MDLNNTTHAWIFFIGGGAIIYLLTAVWSALFIASVPMDDDWCESYFQPPASQGNGYCVTFKNELAQAKHRHNVEVRRINRYGVYGRLVLGAIGGVIVYYWIPRRRDALSLRGEEAVVGGFFYGILTAIFAPMIFRWILPAPITWFPEWLTDIALQNQQEAMQDIMANL